MTHHEKSKIFYALLYFFLLTVSLYFFRCLSAVYYLPACLSVCFSVLLSVCLSVYLSLCLSVCLSMQGWVITNVRYLIFRIVVVQVLQKVLNIFNNLDPLYAFYFSQWFILFTSFWKYIIFLFQGKSSAHKKEGLLQW